ncbi:MAG: LPS sulfotransferase NodH [Paraglaciecola sp.]|jgi:LPS sulfotransferase NodH
MPICQSLGGQKMQQCFPNAYYVFLTRNDILGQVISHAIAKQSGVFITGQKGVKSELTYDFDSINKCLKQIIKDYAAWRCSLIANGRNYLEMRHENIREKFDVSI